VGPVVGKYAEEAILPFTLSKANDYSTSFRSLSSMTKQVFASTSINVRNTILSGHEIAKYELGTALS
jgi:hypothetical protein